MPLPSDAVDFFAAGLDAHTIGEYIGAGTLTVRSRSGPTAGDPARDVRITVRKDTPQEELILQVSGADLVLDEFRTDLVMVVRVTPTEDFDDQNPIHPRVHRGVFAS